MHAFQDYANRNGGSFARKAVVVVMAYLLLFSYVGYNARDDSANGDSFIEASSSGETWAAALFPTTTVPQRLRAAAQAPAAPTVVVNIAAPAAPAAPAGPAVTPPPVRTSTPPTPRGFTNGPAAPTARITEIEPASPRVGYETRLKIVGGDLDGIVRAYSVDWGDGVIESFTVPDRCGAAATEPEHAFPALAHTYNQIGDMNIRIAVFSRGTCDLGGLQTAKDEKRVTVGPYTPSLPQAPAE